MGGDPWECCIRIAPVSTSTGRRWWLTCVTTIPGVSDLSARVTRAEIGGDMSRSPNVGHLISWAGLCRETISVPASSDPTACAKDARWLKTTLIRCVWAAAQKPKFHRLRALRGAKKAIGALVDPHRRLPHAL